MGALGDLNELAKRLGIKESKVRNWKKHKIFVPVAKKPEDGKTLLFNIETEAFKYRIAQELLLEFSLKELGQRFQKVFGRKNAGLMNELQTTTIEDTLLENYINDVFSVEL